MTKGIHHISAIASHGAETVHFYTQILGLRLVKKTINQDDVRTYHLFFGDRLGHPGMDFTFFIFQPSAPGKRGNGLVTTTSFAVPDSSLKFWEKRFAHYKIKHEEISERFGKKRILFYDKDDQQLELVGVEQEELDPQSDIWTTDEVSQENAIRSFYSATLSVISRESTENILREVFGYRYVGSEGNTHLYEVPESQRAKFLEVSEQPSAAFGFNASGTIHHIAFRAANEKEQLQMREKVLKFGLHPTTQINRFWFKSVYFRIPDGILFEIATDGPGFTADENEKELGHVLSLPPFLEYQRKQIEENLPPLLIK
jgi:glyoxalase family protein